jgi:hypothetical protein
MPPFVITRAGPTTWRWATNRVIGTVEALGDGTYRWDEDPTGHAVTAARLLRLYPEPPDRIVYDGCRPLGDQIHPEPPPFGPPCSQKRRWPPPR